MHTLDQAAEALADGRTTARALVEACLARIHDPAGEGARAFLRTYDDAARTSAEAMDALRRVGRAPSRLAGIPISLKDLFDVAGETTAAGSRLLAGAPPAAAHAPVVRRLLAAGLVPVGRTNMTEFAFSGLGLNPHHGTPRAPWRREEGRSPGGSSSGAAVSVADGMAWAAIGTDTGGSCRVPAAACGLVGFKPTARRVPLDGVYPLAPSLDSVGPIAHTVACCEAIDAILSGEDRPPRPAPPIAGLRLAAPESPVLDEMDAATAASYGRALRALEAAGARIEPRRFPALEAIGPANRLGGLAAAEAWAWHRERLESHGEAYDPRVRARMIAGREQSAADYLALLESRRAIIARMAEDAAPYDALVMPTLPVAPPRLDECADEPGFARWNRLLLRNTSLGNFLDGCAVSLPCHRPGDPPCGLMLLGGTGADRALFAIARTVETVLEDARE